MLATIALSLLAFAALVADSAPVANTTNIPSASDILAADFKADDEFRFPANCDLKTGKCKLFVSWRKQGSPLPMQMDFHMVAALEENEWIGFTWFQQPLSTINGDFIIMSVTKPPSDDKKNASVDLVASVTRGNMDPLGVVRPDALPMISNVVAVYNQESKLAIANFSRPLVMKNGIAFAGDLNLCPNWLFMTSPGIVVPNAVQLLTQFQMDYVNGTSFHAVHFKC